MLLSNSKFGGQGPEENGHPVELVDEIPQLSDKRKLYDRLRELIKAEKKGGNWEFSNHGRVARALQRIKLQNTQFPKELELLLIITSGDHGSDQAHEELSKIMGAPGITWGGYNMLMAEIFYSTVFLYGPPGVGKTTIAKELSRITGLSTTDTDEVFRRRVGPIEKFIDEKGEKEFRQQEGEILDIHIQKGGERGAIVSLGGGTLLRPENRKHAEKHGIVITLTCNNVEELLRRIQADANNTRPLLGNTNPQENLKELLQNRTRHYIGFERQVATDGKTITDIATEVRNIISTHLSHALG